jgi:hypothetical protein
MSDDYKTIKVTEKTYDLVQALKHELLLAGVSSLPKEVMAELENGLTVSSVLSAALVCLQQQMR